MGNVMKYTTMNGSSRSSIIMCSRAVHAVRFIGCKMEYVTIFLHVPLAGARGLPCLSLVLIEFDSVALSCFTLSRFTIHFFFFSGCIAHKTGSSFSPLFEAIILFSVMVRKFVFTLRKSNTRSMSFVSPKVLPMRL